MSLVRALVADTLDEGVFLLVDLVDLERRVIQEYLHAVGAGLLESSRRPVGQQVWEPPGPRVVVSALLVRQQQTGIGTPPFGRLDSPLRIEQDRGRVGRERLRDRRLELLHHRIGHIFSACLRQRLLERATLVHGRRPDGPRICRDSLHSGEFPWCDPHVVDSFFKFPRWNLIF